jgi:lysophospholipase L1-like esterase
MGSRRLLLYCLALAACSRVEAQERQAPPPPPPAPPPPAPAPPPPAAEAADAGPPSLTGRRFVLHVGDSTVGYTLGMTLELGKMFKNAGVKYESRTVTAAGLHTFAKSNVLADLVKEKDPDLVIVQLGTNNLTVPHPEVYLSDIKSIVAQTGGRACYWIGPIPLDKPEHGIRALIRENATPCVFYDSFDLKLARQEDGIHPTQPAAKKWADAFWAFTTKR